MSEERSDYHAMSAEDAVKKGVIVTSTHDMELADEVRRLKQRQRDLCVLMGWLRGYITWDAASKALGFPADTLAFRQSGRLQAMVDAAIDEGKWITEETKKATSGGG